MFLQFSDKLEGMLETLETTAEQVEQAEPISAHPGKLKDQLAENQVCDGCMPSFDTLVDFRTGSISYALFSTDRLS